MRTGYLAAGLAVIAVACGGLAYLLTHPYAFAKPLPTAQGTVSAVGLPVNGIRCERSESLQYHHHQHLALYDHGKQVAVPSAIGIPGGEGFGFSCLYWVHTHAGTPNIIHVESPIDRTYTLGDFFAIWHVTRDTASPPGDRYVQQLRAASRSHGVTTFVNGKRWRGSYRDVPLKQHEVIAVEIGSPVVVPQPYHDWSGL